MTPWRPAAAAAAAGLLVGAGMVATRFVIGQTDPASLALLRYVVGLLCLLPALTLSARVRFARRDLLPIALLGITQFGILIALLNYGLQTISSALGALIFATFPLLTMLFAALLGREALTLFKSLGVLLTILGVGFALGEKLLQPGAEPGGWIGELAVFAAALSGALCSVLYRPYLSRYPTLQVGAFAMFASVLFLAMPAAWEGFFAAPPHFTAGGWLAVIFIGASSAAGYYLWLWALRHTTPTKVSVFLALSPITAAALGAWLLSEAISAWFLLGLACVALGLWLAHRPD
jgi:drug/metabolite transporter (DMT)-like permease